MVGDGEVSVIRYTIFLEDVVLDSNYVTYSSMWLNIIRPCECVALLLNVEVNAPPSCSGIHGRGSCAWCVKTPYPKMARRAGKSIRARYWRAREHWKFASVYWYTKDTGWSTQQRLNKKCLSSCARFCLARSRSPHSPLRFQATR